jgi:phospholipase A1
MSGPSIEREREPGPLRATQAPGPVRWDQALVIAALGLGGGTAAAQDLACRTIADSTQRLACYDRADSATRPGAGPSAPPALAIAPTPPTPPAAQPATPAPADQPGLRGPAATQQHAPQPRATLTDRWELDPAVAHANFSVQPYNPVYVLPVVATSAVNRTPSSPSHALPPGESLALQDAEMKFQISFKTKLARGLFFGHGDVWAAYTQSSRWQVYNKDLSRPFRETNYEPEAMLVFNTDYKLFGLDGKLLGLSLNHQSNGRSDPLSRSWNRVIAMAGFERDDWTVMVRPWWRIKEAAANDDNRDIQDMLGRGDLVVTKLWGQHLMSLQLRHSLRGGALSHGSAQVDWSFPLVGSLKGHLQVFSGYGESLIDYNFRQTRAGLGVSLIEWH